MAGTSVVLLALAAARGSGPNAYGATDIFAAVDSDSMAEIKQALADGADINQQHEKTLQTPLSEWRHFMQCIQVHARATCPCVASA